MQPISRTDARNVRHHSSTPMWWPARRQPLRRCHVNPPPHNPRHDAISMRGGNLKHFSKGGELRRISRLVIRASPTAPSRGGATAGSSSTNLRPIDRTSPTRHTSWLVTRAARPNQHGRLARQARPDNAHATHVLARHSCSPAKATGRPPRTPCANPKGATQTFLYMSDSSLSPAQTQVVEGGCELHQGSSPHVDYMVLAPSRLLRFPNPQQANVPSTTTALARSSALRVKPLTDTWLFHSSMAIQVDMLSSQLMTVSLLSL